MGIWYECQDCIFAANSSKLAHKHHDETGHMVDADEEPDD